MRKLIFLSIAFWLCATLQLQAQSGVTCTLEDAAGEVVVVELTVSNEFQINPIQCFYDVSLTITATDGMANQNVIIRVQIGSTYDQWHILPIGQASVSVFPPGAALQLDCGAIENVQFTVIGNPMSTCLDQAFFPVEFTRFEASNIDNGKIKLVWETASESDNEGFDIERSKDGYKWQTLDFLKGAGTTLEKQYYEWIDDKPYPEINYYRLRQLDFDGDEEYSEIVVVKMTNKGEVTLFPNPAGDFVTLDIGNETEVEHIEIYDGQGRLVRHLPLQYSKSRQNLYLEDLAAGVYWVVISSKYDRQQIKLIKQ